MHNKEEKSEERETCGVSGGLFLEEKLAMIAV